MAAFPGQAYLPLHPSVPIREPKVRSYLHRTYSPERSPSPEVTYMCREYVIDADTEPRAASVFINRATPSSSEPSPVAKNAGRPRDATPSAVSAQQVVESVSRRETGSKRTKFAPNGKSHVETSSQAILEKVTSKPQRNSLPSPSPEPEDDKDSSLSENEDEFEESTPSQSRKTRNKSRQESSIRKDAASQRSSLKRGGKRVEFDPVDKSLQKPQGQLGKPRDGGYSLLPTLTAACTSVPITKRDYKEIRNYANTRVEKWFNKHERWGKQDKKVIRKAASEMVSKFPILAEFQSSYPAVDFLQLATKNFYKKFDGDDSDF